MDARRRGAAKVGTLARRATKQTLQLTQPDQFAPLSRDRSGFVPITALESARYTYTQGTKALRSRTWDLISPSLGLCILRPWREDDIGALVRHANNRRVWINLRDRFPTPAPPKKPSAGCSARASSSPKRLSPSKSAARRPAASDWNRNRTSNVCLPRIGFWLGEAHWGKGIMTSALAVCERARIERRLARALVRLRAGMEPRVHARTRKSGVSTRRRAAQGGVQGRTHRGSCFVCSRPRGLNRNSKAMNRQDAKDAKLYRK